MTRSDAEKLAEHVRGAASGLEAEVEVAAVGDVFVVEVGVRNPRAGALPGHFTLWDEDDWEWLRERILGA